MRVALKGVSKEFRGVRALDGITLDIASGERVALVGPNGSGKSTLVRAMMGILRCEGVVRVGDLDPFRRRADLAAHLAYVPQAVPQLGASVGEVTRAVAALRGLEMKEILRTAASMNFDLDAVDRRPVRALSGGMKQKLLITLAFVTPVSLLVLDEPTTSLDADTREAFFELFRQRAKAATLVLSSHRLDEVRRLVSRVVALEEGRVVLDGPVSSPRVAEQLHEGAWWRDSGKLAACPGGG